MRRSSSAWGSRAKLPVTSSSPSSTIMTNPTGKTSAPTSPTRVWSVAVKASVVAKPSRAPERKPRTIRSIGASRALTTPACTIRSSTASGFTYDIRVAPLSCRSALVLDREARPLGHEPEALELQVGVGRAGAGRDVEAVAVRGTHDFAAVHRAFSERGTGVGTPALDRVQAAPELEHGRFCAVHRERLGPPLGDLVGADDGRRRRLDPLRRRDGRRGGLQHADLASHPVELGEADQPLEHLRQLVAGTLSSILMPWLA